MTHWTKFLMNDHRTIWSPDEIITGERLQAIADITITTDPIKRFHTSLPATVPLVCLPGTMNTIELDQLRNFGPFPLRSAYATARRIDEALAPVRRARSIFVYTHLLPAHLITQPSPPWRHKCPI